MLAAKFKSFGREAPPTPGMEHRWGERVPCRLQIRLSTSDGRAGFGRMRDVSMSGAFIESGLRIPLQAHVMIVPPRLGTADDGRAELAAEVVRVTRDGIGIEWRETVAGSICPLLGCATRCARAGGS